MDFTNESDTQLVKRAEACVSKGNAAAKKADEWYISGGLSIAELKKRCYDRGDGWKKFVGENMAISYSQAHRLLSYVGEGHAGTAAEWTEEAAEAARKRKAEGDAKNAADNRKYQVKKRARQAESSSYEEPPCKSNSKPPEREPTTREQIEDILSELSESQLEILLQHARRIQCN